MSTNAIISNLSSADDVIKDALTGPSQNEYDGTLGSIVAAIMNGIDGAIDVVIDLVGSTLHVLDRDVASESESQEMVSQLEGDLGAGVGFMYPSAADALSAVKTVEWVVTNRTRTISLSGGEADLDAVMDPALPRTNLATAINRLIDADAALISISQIDHKPTYSSLEKGCLLSVKEGSVLDGVTPFGLSTPAWTSVSFSGGGPSDGASSSDPDIFGL